MIRIPRKKNTPDSKYWIRLYECMRATFIVKQAELREAVKVLRIKGFSIKRSEKTNKLTFFKPKNMTLGEANHIFQRYVLRFKEQFQGSSFMGVFTGRIRPKNFKKLCY